MIFHYVIFITISTYIAFIDIFFKTKTTKTIVTIILRFEISVKELFASLSNFHPVRNSKIVFVFDLILTIIVNY